MSRKSIQIVDGFRDSYDNEFFFRSDPAKTVGIQELLNWIDEYTDLKVVYIPSWQIKSKIKGEMLSYSYGVRLESKYE